MEQTEYLYLINPENPNIPETSGDNIMKILEYLLPIQAKIIVYFLISLSSAVERATVQEHPEHWFSIWLSLPQALFILVQALWLRWAVFLCCFGWWTSEILLSVIYTLTLVITSLYITIHPSVFGYLLAVVSFSYGFLYGLPLSGTFINVLSYMTYVSLRLLISIEWLIVSSSTLFNSQLLNRLWMSKAITLFNLYALESSREF